MCTVVILRRPGHAWPLILAANRDEMSDRPWRPPGSHWPDRPDVVAGIDLLAGGTWLGLNRYGVVAGVLNRRHSLGPAPDTRSRGELPLEALDHASARDAADALVRLEPRSYRSFNMAIADADGAFWLSSRRGEEGVPPDEGVRMFPLTAGLSMLTASDLNDERASPRIHLYLPRFRSAPAPDPERGEWAVWESLLASRDHSGNGPEGAMTVVTDSGFGTVSSSIVALPRRFEGKKPVWLFCPGRPSAAPFAPVSL
ncbi:MAG: hypothetical protein EXQ86_00160 [Rhodospirillales bacterium]|nr:hypothetical protein [Rhodospirillales bacterium]